MKGKCWHCHSGHWYKGGHFVGVIVYLNSDWNRDTCVPLITVLHIKAKGPIS